MKSAYGTMYYVDNMKDAVAYYKKMGGTPGYESDFWTEFELAGHKLCLHAKNQKESYPVNGILILSHTGIKNLFETMKGDNYNVFGLHQVHEDMWSFHVKDQSGNEFSYYGKV